MKIQMIPLSQLAPSHDNVRKTGVNEGIESLTASIRVHGLLQNLQVRQIDKGKYEVLAAARRPQTARQAEGLRQGLGVLREVCRCVKHKNQQSNPFGCVAQVTKIVDQIVFVVILLYT